MKDQPPTPRGAPKGNKNAAKPEDQHLEAVTWVYSTKPERAKWVKEAQKVPKRSLSEWLRGLANRELAGKS